jgi:hypothetical protein
MRASYCFFEAFILPVTHLLPFQRSNDGDNPGQWLNSVPRMVLAQPRSHFNHPMMVGGRIENHVGPFHRKQRRTISKFLKRSAHA